MKKLINVVEFLTKDSSVAVLYILSWVIVAVAGYFAYTHNILWAAMFGLMFVVVATFNAMSRGILGILKGEIK